MSFTCEHADLKGLKNPCKNCKDLPEYRTIYRTEAKKIYNVSDEQLASLPSRVKNFTKSRSGTMYLEHMIAEFGLAEVDYDAEYRKQRRVDLKLERRGKLTLALEKCGLELRSDSRLCEMYINGNKERKLREVVHEMCIMQYLYNYTDYVREKGRLMFSTSPQERASVARSNILSELGEWPNPWPWISSE